MITRFLDINKNIKPGKVLLLMGPRRVGKTTLLDDFLEKSKAKFKKYDGNNIGIRDIFSQSEISLLSGYIDGFDILAIDEAQNIKNIGETLKTIVDSRPKLKIIATGSSSFDLIGQVGEPLVGRKITRYLYPFSVTELVKNKSDLNNLLNTALIYGLYPDSILAENNDERREYLDDLVGSLLLRDILTFQDVKGSDVIYKILQLLAFQIGSEVSIEELGQKVGINKNTVSRYLNLLEKSYIIFRLSGFSRNLRKEITKKSKYYFYDLGIRNAVINNFNRSELRDDMGPVWENFAIVERMKKRNYAKDFSDQYFWRTWSQNEIDLIEEKDGKFNGFEFKWNGKKQALLPRKWSEVYGDISFKTITPDNLLEFIK